MAMNWAVFLLTALIPMAVGFIWYSKPVFGNSWMRANRFHPEDMKGGNMVLIFGLTFVFSVLLTVAVSTIVIHQFSLGGVVGGRPTNAVDKKWLEDAMKAYGHSFRSFKHGVLHGTLASFFFALPVIAIISLFERRGWKYVLIHWGYWLVTLALMGGVLSQWL